MASVQDNVAEEAIRNLREISGRLEPMMLRKDVEQAKKDLIGVADALQKNLDDWWLRPWGDD